MANFYQWNILFRIFNPLTKIFLIRITQNMKKFNKIIKINFLK